MRLDVKAKVAEINRGLERFERSVEQFESTLDGICQRLAQQVEFARDCGQGHEDL